MYPGSSIKRRGRGGEVTDSSGEGEGEGGGEGGGVEVGG